MPQSLDTWHAVRACATTQMHALSLISFQLAFYGRPYVQATGQHAQRLTPGGKRSHC